MNKTTKIILMSVVTIIACVSLISGATFALFTSESSVNVAVTSGKVNVVAKIDEDSLKTYSFADDGSGTYSSQPQAPNSFIYGSANLAGNTLSLSGIVPGDKAEFSISLTNESTVAVKYQIKVSVDGDESFYRALNVSGFGEDLTDSVFTAAKLSDWQSLEQGSEPIVMPIVIELPYDYNDNIVNGNAESSVQGKEVTLTFTVNAVQGNAKTENPIKADPAGDVLPVYDAEDLANFGASTNAYHRYEGQTVKLSSDIVLTDDWTPISAFAGTFDGGGHTVTLAFNRKMAAEDTNLNLGVFDTISGEIKNLTVTGSVNVAVQEGATLGESAHVWWNIGGFIARSNGKSISDCVSKVNITVDLSAAQSVKQFHLRIGGIYGSTGSKNCHLENCENQGDIRVTGLYKAESSSCEVLVGGITSAVTRENGVEVVLNNLKNTGIVTIDHDNVVEIGGGFYGCGDILGAITDHLDELSTLGEWQYVGKCSIGARIAMPLPGEVMPNIELNIAYGTKIA